MTDTSKDNRRMAREYFESGCLCLLKGSIQKQDEAIDSDTAAAYYERNCTCSRNYKHLES